MTAAHIAEQLSRRKDWQSSNNAIKLANAHIIHWLRTVLYDAAENLPVLESLLNESIAIQSPDELLRKGNSLWDVISMTQDQIEQFSNALKHPVIVEQLRNAYGHAGVMHTLYLGIDPVPAFDE